MHVFHATDFPISDFDLTNFVNFLLKQSKSMKSLRVFDKYGILFEKGYFF